MLNVDKVYVIHYTKLSDRRKRMEDMLGLLGVVAEYITDFDQEHLDEETLLQMNEDVSEEFNKKIKPLYPRISPKKLSKAEVSCVFKHRQAIQKLSNSSSEYGLILEDDVVFVEGFKEKFDSYLLRTPDDSIASWDIVFIGVCCGMHVDSSRIKKDVVAYKIGHPSSRCADSYLLKKSAAKKIIDSSGSFPVTPYDYDLSYQIVHNNLNAYWWEPPLAEQGSQNGLYGSSIQ